MKTKDPQLYIPESPADFVGQSARQTALILAGKAKALREARAGTVKLLLYGPPGTGKTRLAEMFAQDLAGHAICIESVNGRNVTLETVRAWQQAAHYRPLYGLFNVKIVNELDTCPAAAQDLLLTYLDEMPDCTALIGTSNLNLAALCDRFQSRLQQFKVKAPATEELVAFLRQFRLKESAARQTAVGCGGNVRAALLDAQSILDAQLVQPKGG